MGEVHLYASRSLSLSLSRARALSLSALSLARALSLSLSLCLCLARCLSRVRAPAPSLSLSRSLALSLSHAARRHERVPCSAPACVLRSVCKRASARCARKRALDAPAGERAREASLASHVARRHECAPGSAPAGELRSICKRASARWASERASERGSVVPTKESASCTEFLLLFTALQPSNHASEALAERSQEGCVVLQVARSVRIVDIEELK